MLLAEARIGAELRAAQERGEVGVNGGDRRSISVQTADAGPVAFAATGIPRQRATGYKALAAASRPLWHDSVEAWISPDRRLARLLARAITPEQRARIERDVALLIELLDAADASGEDLETDDEDCCEAADDNPTCSQPRIVGCGSAYGPGDPADGEITPEDEGEPTDDDLPHRELPAAALRPTTTPCSNGPFQPDSSTYAAVRGWHAGLPGRPA